METFFKKYFWTFTLVVLVACGSILGVAASNMIASVLSPPPGKITINTQAQSSNGIKNKGAFILGRNIFNSEALSASEAGDESETAAEQEETSPEDGDVPETDLDVTLRVTMASKDPDWSIAVLDNGRETFVVRVGSTIDPDAVVKAIFREKVYVQRGDRVEMLTFKDDAAGSGRSYRGRSAPYGNSRQRSGARPSASRQRISPSSAIASGVKKVSDTEYQVDRSMLEEQLQDLNKLGTQARIIPHYKNGKANGFKLVGIRPGSIYSYIGIRSGDVIRKVNGEEINTPNKALELYQKLRNASNISVDIERRGQRKTLNYTIK